MAKFIDVNGLKAVIKKVNDSIKNKADKDHEHDVATIDELLSIYDEMQLEVPATIDDVATSVAAVNVALNGLKADVYNQPAGADVNTADVSDMYVAVALPGDEMYAAATKEIKDVPQTVKMSVGNNNFLTFDQYKIEGNELKLAIPTMLLDDDGKFELEAAGYKNADIAVAVPDMQEPEVVVKKHATFNAGEYNIAQVGNEVNIELVSTVSTPSWANSGRLLLLFDFLGADKVSLINADSTFITKKIYRTGGEDLGMTGPDNMAAEGEEAKQCLAMYVPVKDVAYDLKYKAILIGSDYKCMNITIHVPANI